jgi:hypothetical protein
VEGVGLALSAPVLAVRAVHLDDPDAEQSADGIERGGDVRIGMGVHAAGDGACVFYDGYSHPFLRLRDGTAPAGPPDL